MRKFFLFVLVAAALLGGCKRNAMPEGVLTADRMADFLSEAYLLEGFYAIESGYAYDEVSPEVLRAYDDILKRQHITREQVEASFAYYAEHPDEYIPVLDTVIARIESDVQFKLNI